MKWSEIFYYDETSPSCLRWNVDVFRYSQIIYTRGSPAGSCSGDNYWRVCYKGQREQASRVIWQLFNGEIPKGMLVDHVNLDKLDNRVVNLRLATYHQNATNRPLDKRNTSGFSGVRERVMGDRSAFVAYWMDFSGKNCTKSFSVQKYGRELAHQLAIQARLEAERKLTEEAGLFY